MMQRPATAVVGTAPGVRPRENGDASGEGGLSEMDRRQRELYAKQQQLLREQRSQDQEKLLACISGAAPLRPNLCCLLVTPTLLSFHPLGVSLGKKQSVEGSMSVACTAVVPVVSTT